MDKAYEFIEWLSERVDEHRERYTELCSRTDVESLRSQAFWRWNESLYILTELMERTGNNEGNNQTDV